ncbi:hypothetical protein SJ05684_c01040 [Sinorhizobium sojae CCBAU 05684]|uniref:Uncharacterized protein n=1 Tax=Sinorhizobium sojae CCBAU 05684 TaxID=716928 RepID=A0A249P6Z6_9HYPH|nr:hypothetical protein SJ05684_c01040 [Sinorhizobium sojae CCBAU 05684]
MHASFRHALSPSGRQRTAVLTAKENPSRFPSVEDAAFTALLQAVFPIILL